MNIKAVIILIIQQIFNKKSLFMVLFFNVKLLLIMMYLSKHLLHFYLYRLNVQ